MGGRQFDAAKGNRWFEIKSIDWNHPRNVAGINDMKAKFGSANRIASDNNATFEVISKNPMPTEMKEYLTKKGIRFTEGI